MCRLVLREQDWCTGGSGRPGLQSTEPSSPLLPSPTLLSILGTRLPRVPSEDTAKSLGSSQSRILDSFKSESSLLLAMFSTRFRLAEACEDQNAMHMVQKDEGAWCSYPGYGSLWLMAWVLKPGAHGLDRTRVPRDHVLEWAEEALESADPDLPVCPVPCSPPA